MNKIDLKDFLKIKDNIYTFIEQQIEEIFNYINTEKNEFIKNSLSNSKLISILDKMNIQVYLARIEILKNQQAKYEYDKDFEQLILSRFSPLAFPACYGCLNNTLSKDGDPTDVLVFNSNTTPANDIQNNTLMYCVPFCSLAMDDNGEEDYKVLSLALNGLIDILKDGETAQIINDIFNTICFFTNPNYKKVNKFINLYHINNREETIKYINSCEDLFELEFKTE